MLDYVVLNNKNRKNMRGSLNRGINFEWEDYNILNDVIKKIEYIYPPSFYSEEFKDGAALLKVVNGLFDKLYGRKIDDKTFLEDLKINLEKLVSAYPNLQYSYKYRFDYYNEIIENSHRLLINGYAGIGKSYFIYKLEEELTKIKIPHLCVYGKYNNNISHSIFEEIMLVEGEFYLLIDALNEFDEEEQISIIKEIKKICKRDNINIIVTYRNYTIKKPILLSLQRIISNSYEFKGVDFESSLLMMIERFGINAMRHIEVIETNNPLYILMLNEILSDDKLKEESINGIVQITHIMEYYIKKSCKELGKHYWNFVKEIGKVMLNRERNYITEDELRLLSGAEYDDFVNKMIENGFMYKDNYDFAKIFLFSIHELSDYIIARPLFHMITDKDDYEVVDIVNKKIKRIPSLSEAISILIFEKYKEGNLKKAIRIFLKSNLCKNIDFEFLKKISFSDSQIDIIQNTMRIKDVSHAYRVFGGFQNRPFNCTNYINKILLSNSEYELNIVERFNESSYLVRLKNIAYSIQFLNDQKDIIYEYFYYSFWLMSSANERIRNLSIKIVYDLSFINSELKKELISNYKVIKDYYIKNGIIHILTKLPRDNNVEKFLKKIYRAKDELDAENIYRIAKYFNAESSIPTIHKQNLYKKLPRETIVDDKLNLGNIIFMADFYEKSLLKFETYPTSNNTLSLNQNFIINSPNAIRKYNKKLNRKFDCIMDDGYCKYSIGGKKLQDRMYKIDIKSIDIEKFFLVYQEIFKRVSRQYNYDYLSEEKFDSHINRFCNSLLKKILLISQNILLGSLMTNYYTEEFSIFNDEVTLGYRHFSYMNYDEENINLTAPISPYNELIDKLNDKICEKIGLYDERNYEWFEDVQLSKDICSKLTKEIIYNGESWSLIGGCINRFVSNEISESYSCYMAINPTCYLDGSEDSRKLTIENEYYYGNVDDYKNINYDKNMKIPSFQHNSIDIKESGLSFPSPKLVRLLNLKYDPKVSSWNDEKGNLIILCDNNPKQYFKYPIYGSIYIKTSVLNELKKNNIIVYWCYTEKLYGKYGWNDDASLHIQLDCNGDIDSVYNNYRLNKKRLKNNKCENCKFGIYTKCDDDSYDDMLGLVEEIMKEYKDK